MAENIRKEIENKLTVLGKNVNKFSSAVEMIDEARKLTTAAEKNIKETYDHNRQLLDKSSSSFGELLETQKGQLKNLDTLFSELKKLEVNFAKSDIPFHLEKLGKQLDIFEKKITGSLKSQSTKQTNLRALIKDNDIKREQTLQGHITSIDESIKDLSDKISKHLEENFKSIKSQINHSFAEIVKSTQKSADEIQEHHTNQFNVIKSEIVNNRQYLTKTNRKIDELTKITFFGLGLVILLQIITLVMIFS